jgi:hypothetical protein
MARRHLPTAWFALALPRITTSLLIAATVLGADVLFRGKFDDHSIVHAQSRTATVPAPSAGQSLAELWQEPSGDRRDLFYGPGGPGHQPDAHETFTFLGEDLSGSHAKFNVQDSRGIRWKVKLGTEARPETVATRVVWAAGYAADEDYFVEEIHVDNMPQRLHRGQQLLGPNGIVRNARLKRVSNERKEIAQWAWRQNPFSGTRELNGLRVLMAVINNWDLKDVNNAVLEVGRVHADGMAEHVFEVKDLGSSFGAAGLGATDHSNGDLRAYRSSRFITHMTADTVTFKTPGVPDWIVFANVRQVLGRLRLLWIGKAIPRADARWMGSVLAQIPPDSIRDAFRAAGYGPDDVEGFTTVVESRIHQLNNL